MGGTGLKRTLIILTLLIVGVPAVQAGDAERAATPAPASASPTNLDLAVAVPPFSDGIYPCSDCHSPDDVVNTTPRKLEAFHEDIVFEHDAEHRWCLDCHDARNRDVLHLASGAPVPFTESYRLCGQCHGTHYRDWRAGEHGKRTGSWSGQKQYLLCVHCHNPHSPHFKPIKPLPPPIREELLKHQEAKE